MPDDRKHFSASQLDEYCRCPEAYRRHRIEGERIPPSVVQIRGTGYHRAAAANMRQKLTSGVDMKPRDIVDLGMSEFETEAKGGVSLNIEEAKAGYERVIGTTADDLREILDIHAREQAPCHMPTLVEQQVRIPLPNAPRDLLGVLDLATTNDDVIDFKSTKRSKSQSEVDGSVQLTIYAVAHKFETGRPARSVQLDNIVQMKTKTFRQVLTSTRDERDFAALANRINAVQHAIDAGSFPPAAPGTWNCSDKYCVFHRTCPFVNPGRATQGD
jgi:CRISPR/Cas system-associated exonuclease Cas4 (RecB family)